MFMGEPLKLEIGDAEAALAAAPYKVDATYRTPRHNHNAIELHAATLAWDGDDADRPRRLAGRRAHAPGRSPRCSASTKSRSTSPRPTWAAASAARRCGSTRCWPRRRRSSRAGRCASALSREGVYRIVGGRTLTEQRVAIGAQADGRFDALIHTGTVGDDRAQRPARAVHPAGAQRLCRRQLQARRRGRPISTCSPTPSCARPAKRSAPSRSNARSTSWRTSWAWTRSSCGSATSRTRTRPTARPSRRATSSRPTAPAPSGSAGASAAASRARAARANGWSAWAAPPRPIPITACRAAPRGSR